MREEEKSPRIVVRDRRPFAPDGSRRVDAEPRTEAPASAPPSAPGPQAATPAGPGAPAAVDPGDPPQEDHRFKQLVSLLFSQAAMLLDQASEADGKSGSASGPQRAEALQGLQAVIGVLEVLEEKTRGRLAPGDARLVSKALYELRMAYMQRTEAPGQPPGG